MIYTALFLVIVLADQLIKMICVNSLQSIGTIPLIEGILHFTYVENRGAAFGIFQNAQVFFIVVTTAVLIGAVIFLKIKKPTQPVLLTSITLIAAGAVGNLIDRIFRGYVVDFIDFRVFPVFNIADIAVCCGAALFILYILFLEKKENE